VFYNPAMAMDRDIGVAVVRAWSETHARLRTGWEMMAATGARGLRLVVEAGPFDAFTLTEANPEAAGVLAENARGQPGVRVLVSDARRGPDGAPFDYVDLDPYGTPSPFAATALGAVRPGGILAVTATDMMVLAGVQAGAAERRYGSHAVRGRLGPEGGLRILLAFLARAARSNGRAVRSVVSYVGDHHVRAFVQVTESGPADDPVGPIDLGTWEGPEVGAAGPYGPLWLGRLFDPDIVRALRVPPNAADPRGVAVFLSRLQEEVAADVPFYYESNELAATLSLASPPSLVDLLTALRSQGFRAGRTHARPEGFRTDAPRTEVERLARGLGRSGQSQNARVRA